METETLINELTEIQGVTGISIMTKDGVVVDSHNFLETDNALVGFAGNTVNDAANMFTLGNAKKSLIKGPGYKILIIFGKDHYFGVIMDEGADEDIVETTLTSMISG